MSSVFDRRNINWLLGVEVRPTTRRDKRALARLIPALSAEHDGFLAMAKDDLGAVLLGARDELELERNFILLRDKLSDRLEIGAPEVGYREAITRAAQVDHRRDVRSGGPPRLRLAVEPRGVGAAPTFETRVAPGALADTAHRTIERGIMRALDRGPVAGYPVIGVLVGVLETDLGAAAKDEKALNTAVWAAVRDALSQAGPILLEPIMKLRVTTPPDFAGALIADLESRRGQIMGADTRDERSTIDAEVPLANLFGYANSLVHMTQGRATYSLAFSHYAKVPGPSDDEPPWPEPASAALRA